MRKIGIVLAVAALLAVSALFFRPGAQAASGKGNQTVCPVMGFAIDERIFTDYQAKRIYFCCPSCPPEFKKDPDKYVDRMRADGVLLEDAPGHSAAAPVPTQEP